MLTYADEGGRDLETGVCFLGLDICIERGMSVAVICPQYSHNTHEEESGEAVPLTPRTPGAGVGARGLWGPGEVSLQQASPWGQLGILSKALKVARHIGSSWHQSCGKSPCKGKWVWPEAPDLLSCSQTSSWGAWGCL